MVSNRKLKNTSRDTLSDKKRKGTDKLHHEICQYFTFNMGQFHTFVAVQVTDEGERD